MKKRGGYQVTSQMRPALAPETILRAVWVGAGESPEWIVAHTNAMLGQLRSLFDIDQWRTLDHQRWEGAEDDLAQIVRSTVYMNDAHEPPRPDPESGYQLWLTGEGPRVRIRVEISAGAASSGGPIPLHHLTVHIRELSRGAVDGNTIDEMCAAVATIWAPSMVKVANSSINSLARRGNWKIGIGYRTWISSEVGAVNRVAEGLTATELAGGTLISAPDDWPAERVVVAMSETLAANELDEVPH
ncbi:hypothetical protein [Mycolicibacterium mucogenicum]|nr:hypothetical protein [Mycolicibacterium mucogenicum]